MSEYYLNNPKLKRANVKIAFTQQQVEEYQKCAADPIYFIEKYCKIINIDKGLVNFKLYDFQKEMIDVFIHNRFAIAKCPRQVGKTIAVSGYLLWVVLFKGNQNIAVLANKDRQAKVILARIKFMFEHLPKWLQMGVTEWNKGNIELENNSKIIASSTSSSAIRGDSYTNIYLDEFAHVPKNIQDEFFASVYPTISAGETSKIIITSTPKGMDLFYKIWSLSEQGKNSYARIDVHWSQIPGRTEEWKKQTIANTSEEQFREEFECEFVGSSNTLIAGKYLSKLLIDNPILENHIGLKTYDKPKEKSVYALIVDVARGVGADASAFVVIDITSIPYKVCGTFKNNTIAPMVFPEVIIETAKRYNNAFILVETNDIGQQVADIIHHDYGYENILTTVSSTKTGQVLSGGFGSSVHFGVKTTKQVKRIGCLTLKSLIENNKLIINDYEIIYELHRFVQKGSSYEAEDGNDDLVMCCVLFGWLTTQKYILELTNQDLRANFIEQNLKMIEEEMVPFGCITTGDLEIDAYRMAEERELRDEFTSFDYRKTAENRFS